MNYFKVILGFLMVFSLNGCMAPYVAIRNSSLNRSEIAVYGKNLNGSIYQRTKEGIINDINANKIMTDERGRYPFKIFNNKNTTIKVVFIPIVGVSYSLPTKTVTFPARSKIRETTIWLYPAHYSFEIFQPSGFLYEKTGKPDWKGNTFVGNIENIYVKSDTLFGGTLTIN